MTDVLGRIVGRQTLILAVSRTQHPKHDDKERDRERSDEERDGLQEGRVESQQALQLKYR